MSYDFTSIVTLSGIVLSIFASSCSQGGAGGANGGGGSSQDTSGKNYSSIHYSNGNSISKNLWLSMIDDHKLTNVCNQGQSYFNDKCWDNLNIDIDNANVNVSNSDGTSQNILSNYQVSNLLYSATQSKFSGTSYDKNCLRVTTEFVPDTMRATRDTNLGTSDSCWYTTTYNMPWPFSPIYQTLPGNNALYYIDFQTFVRYGDIESTSYINTWYGNIKNDTYTHNWWLNGTLNVYGKQFNLSSTNIKEIENATGKSINTKNLTVEKNGYVLSITFDFNYNTPYLSITNSYEQIDQSKKSLMKPVIISIYKK